MCVFAASLFVKGPTEPVVEGQSVTLECLDSESELNVSSMHFEKMSRVRFNYSKANFVLCELSPSQYTFSCLLYSFKYQEALSSLGGTVE